LFTHLTGSSLKGDMDPEYLKNEQEKQKEVDKIKQSADGQ